MKAKELVTLREKPMRNGGSSLFLDYSIDGVRVKEYLKMYIVPEKTKIDKLQNIETRKTASAMKAKKIIDLQNGIGGFTRRTKDICLVDYIASEKERYKESGKKEYAMTVGKLLTWLQLYNKRIAMRRVDREYLLAFFRYLEGSHQIKKSREDKAAGRPMTEEGLSIGTIHTYSQVLSTLFNTAVRRKLIDHNPMHDLEISEKPQRPESEREFLTLEEVQQLRDTRCGNENVKRAFLFACFTGLRLSDIERLRPEMIRPTADGLEVEMRQQKTQRMVYIPMSPNAASFLPEGYETKKKIFTLPTRNEINANIRRWVANAGISKHITFHCSRHTYATLLLTYGADIYTVSKLLGHSSVDITQVYAKVIDKKKVEAVNLIPSL